MEIECRARGHKECRVRRHIYSVRKLARPEEYKRNHEPWNAYDQNYIVCVAPILKNIRVDPVDQECKDKQSVDDAKEPYILMVLYEYLFHSFFIDRYLHVFF